MRDAFRAPLQEVFRLLETIRNHEDLETKITLLQHCYQVRVIKRRDSKASTERMLPEYSCLLSPANLRQQNLQSFSLDANIINTVYNYQMVMEAVPLVVAGHSQEVECLVTDGETVVSSCLRGKIKVWDSQNAKIIERGAFFKLQKDLYEKVSKKSHLTSEAHEVNHSPETSPTSENVHRLCKGLSSYLSGLRFRAVRPRDSPRHLSTAETTKYDFTKNCRRSNGPRRPMTLINQSAV